MRTGQPTQKRTTNSVNLERVFQCYVFAGLFSTSGVDVLLVMTLVFLLFASVQQTVALFSRGDAVLS